MPQSPCACPPAQQQCPLHPAKLLLPHISTRLVKAETMRHQARACTHAVCNNQLLQPKWYAKDKQTPAMPHTQGAENVRYGQSALAGDFICARGH